MRRIMVLAVSVLGVLFLSVPDGFAQPGLRVVGGEYFVVGSRSCAYVNGYQDFAYDESHNAYSLPTLYPSTGGTTRTGHYQGSLTLNANGTGTWKMYTAQYYHQATAPGASPFRSFNSTCDVSFEELDTGRLVLRILNGCVSTEVSGPTAGTKWVTDEETLTFGTSMGGDILLLSNTRPVIETTWDENAPSNVIERLCSRTMMAVRRSISR